MTDVASPRMGSGHLVHLNGMENINDAPECRDDRCGEFITLTELATYLRVPVQTLYDLRSQGRGPRGFRVGREIRFRWAEIDAWLARLEAADGDRHQTTSGEEDQ